MSKSDHNHVSLIGRLTRDPELQFTSGNTAVCHFSLASNRTYKKSSGDVVEHVAFFDITAWGKLGELINQYMRKGSQCLIAGHLDQQRWTNKDDGKQRSKVVVVADEIQFLGGKREGTAGSSAPSNAQHPATQPSAAASASASADPDEVLPPVGGEVVDDGMIFPDHPLGSEDVPF